MLMGGEVITIQVNWVYAVVLAFILYDISKVLVALFWRRHYKKHYGRLSSIDPKDRTKEDRSVLLAASSLLTQRPELGPTVHTELESYGFSVSLRVDEPLLVHDLLHILSEERNSRKSVVYEFVVLGVGENDLAIRPWSVFSVRWWERLRRCLELAQELGHHVILVHGMDLVPKAPAIPWFYRNVVIRPSIFFAKSFLFGELSSFPSIRVLSVPKDLDICPDGTHISPESHRQVAKSLLHIMQEEGKKDDCYGSTIDIR